MKTTLKRIAENTLESMKGSQIEEAQQVPSRINPSQ